MVTVNAGFGRQFASADLAGRTVQSVLEDANLRAVLGFGDSVQGIVNGTRQSGGYQLQSGDTLVVETVAASKA